MAIIDRVIPTLEGEEAKRFLEMAEKNAAHVAKKEPSQELKSRWEQVRTAMKKAAHK